MFEKMSKNISVSEKFDNLDSSKPNHFMMRIYGYGSVERDMFYHLNDELLVSKDRALKVYNVGFELFNMTNDQIEHPWIYEVPQVITGSNAKYMSNFPWDEENFLDVISHVKREFDHYHEMIKTIESYGYHFFGHSQNGDFAFGRLVQEKIDEHHDLFAELELEHGETTARIIRSNSDAYFKGRDWTKGSSYHVEKGDFLDALVSFEKTIVPKVLKRDTFMELNPSLRDAITKLETPLRFTER